MAGFNFEKNLEHQSHAVAATVGVFDGVAVEQAIGVSAQFANPRFTATSHEIANNVAAMRTRFAVSDGTVDGTSTIIDIMMETGTGKTYTYTKTMFEMNKLFGIFKFVIVVPTLPIKAGTINFLRSQSTREHFKEQYGKQLQLHIVESQKSGKSKKSVIPTAVQSFVGAGSYERNHIQVLVINAGMVNSDTMQKRFDTSLFDQHAVPFDAIAATRPIMIIDEPHKFAKDNKTWSNLERMRPQYTIRYGATFPETELKKKNSLGKTVKVSVKDYHNLVYTLTAVDSFNKNLVKGVIGHVAEFEAGRNALVKLISLTGTEAKFELTEGNRKSTRTLGKKDTLSKVHVAMEGLTIENMNKSCVVLSNGLELKKGDKLNPYSYAETLQESMIKKAVKNHFELEYDLLQRDTRIKPLTLFFIDNIDEYRGKDGYIRKTVEKHIKAEAKRLLTQSCTPAYKTFLEATLTSISDSHGGYFSQDNTDSDEKIEKEVNEILHDKEEILRIDNTRRFIFSKWTLREGWDNPNVFQICKLRSSGSDISKLQEVGRGLRLPVNEYGNREKDEQFFLHYFVDFTENDFVNQLVAEINKKSGAISRAAVYERLTDEMVAQIVEKYSVTEESLLETLDKNNVITRSNQFKDGGLAYIQSNYSLIFEGVDSNKIRKANDVKKRVTVRTEKYTALQELWEKLNEKVILEYKIDDEEKFKTLFVNFLKQSAAAFKADSVRSRIERVVIEDGQAVRQSEVGLKDSELTSLTTMNYGAFLRQLGEALHMNIATLHGSFKTAKINPTPFLNQTTIRIIKQKFDAFLLYNAIDAFTIEYQRVTNTIHPTKFTNKEGKVVRDAASADVGVMSSTDRVAPNYFFNELFFDSELEKQNIITNITEVLVFTKIPKNSIKIPVAGGKSYSPDFAYVLNFKDGQKKLYFIVETKNTTEEGLRDEERAKIKHAEKFFGGKVKIKFKTQFEQDKIVDLIQQLTVS
ncbi:type III restriction-modification system endonuclease [Patescibacteria group bacterium]|nr:type III restriction-modification system endonuclease [Patescibacteria group bacterium]